METMQKKKKTGKKLTSAKGLQMRHLTKEKGPAAVEGHSVLKLPSALTDNDMKYLQHNFMSITGRVDSLPCKLYIEDENHT